jgi:hypothetical protein
MESRNSLKDVRKSQMMPDQVRKWLRQQSKDFYAAGFDTLVEMEPVYQSWRICREINIFLQVQISHVLHFISICDLFSGSPSYMYVKKVCIIFVHIQITMVEKTSRTSLSGNSSAYVWLSDELL